MCNKLTPTKCAFVALLLFWSDFNTKWPCKWLSTLTEHCTQDVSIYMYIRKKKMFVN